MLMLQKIRELRTNENALIAVDVLLHSKSAFMNIFLMSFLMSVSINSSPASFITYCIVRYSLIALFSVLLMPLMKHHTLAAWRVSMFFSVAQILSVILLDETAPYFTYIIATFSALESALYWRPKMYYDVTEVGNARRLRFKAVGQIFIEIVKIIMPIVLGIAIADSGYTQAGFIILAISLMQLLLSVLFRPTHRVMPRRMHSLRKIYDMIIRHKSLRKIFYIQLLRGFAFASAAYIIIAQVNVYRSSGSDLDLGVFTSAASIIAILILAFYRRLKTRVSQQAILYSIVPAAILLPISLIIFPNNSVLSVAFYIFSQAVIESFLNGTVLVTRLQQLLNGHLADDSYRFEIESFSEVALTVGRVLGQSILLLIILLGYEKNMMYFAALEAFAIFPLLEIALPAKNRL